MKRLFSLLYSAFQMFLFTCKPIKRKNAVSVSVIYKPDAIGDFILASGAIRALLHGTDQPWLLVTAPAVARLAKQQFPDLEIVVLNGAYDRDLLSFWKRIRSIRSFTRSYHVNNLVCLRHVRNGIDQVILNWMSPLKSFACVDAPISPLPPGGILRFRFSEEIPYPKSSDDDFPLEIQAHRAVLEAFTGVNPGKLAPGIQHHSDPPREAPYVLVFPATRSRLRTYPVPRLARALSSALTEPGHPDILILGLPEEADVMNALHSGLAELDRVECFFPPDLNTLMRYICHAHAVVSTESAPAHFAIVFERPGVFLLGAGHWGHFAPWKTREDQYWLYTLPECKLCNWNCPFSEPFCLTDISERTITDAVRSVLHTPSTS